MFYKVIPIHIRNFCMYNLSFVSVTFTFFIIVRIVFCTFVSKHPVTNQIVQIRGKYNEYWLFCLLFESQLLMQVQILRFAIFASSEYRSTVKR